MADDLWKSRRASASVDAAQTGSPGVAGNVSLILRESRGSEPEELRKGGKAVVRARSFGWQNGGPPYQRGHDRLSNEGKYPSVLKSLTIDQRKEMGLEYITDTFIHRDKAPRFTDKMPNNFRHIGLIHLILPNAKIIDARRSNANIRITSVMGDL